MTPFWPQLDRDSGLPTWIRADLRAMPTDNWAGRNDLRTRRPLAVRKVPVRPAGRPGAAGHPTAGQCRGRTALAALLVVALVVWWRQ